MRLYKISTSAANLPEGSAHLPATIFAGSLAESAAARKVFTDLGIKRKDIESVEVDVPTDKQGLLGYLNKLVA